MGAYRTDSPFLQYVSFDRTTSLSSTKTIMTVAYERRAEKQPRSVSSQIQRIKFPRPRDQGVWGVQMYSSTQSQHQIEVSGRQLNAPPRRLLRHTLHGRLGGAQSRYGLKLLLKHGSVFRNRKTEQNHFSSLSKLEYAGNYRGADKSLARPTSPMYFV